MGSQGLYIFCFAHKHRLARNRTLEKPQWLNEAVLMCITFYCFSKIGGPPGVLGIWGEGLFIFRELGSTANYFRGAGEQAHTFGDIGSTAKKKISGFHFI